MPNDPEIVAECRSWFTRAHQDLAAASHEFTATPPLLEDIVFHTQQAVEKALKGFLAWHSQVFRKTHNLEELGEQCLKIDYSLKPEIDRAVPLTEYAWKFRYPGEPIEPTEREAREALEVARSVVNSILSRLPDEVKGP
jgi:HEPN domain-containing protein